MSLFALDYIESIVATAEQIEMPMAREIFLANCAGITLESDLKRACKCNRNLWGKSRQYLVDNQFVVYDRCKKKLHLCNKMLHEMQLFVASRAQCKQMECKENINEKLQKQNSTEIEPEIDSESTSDFDLKSIVHLGQEKDLEGIYQEFCKGIHNKRLHPPIPRNLSVPPTPRKQIDSTDEIADIILNFDPHHRKIHEDKKKRRKYAFKERHLADDLIDRIVLMPLTIGVYDSPELIKEWQEQVAHYKAEYPDKSGWMALADTVAVIYEDFDVVWEPVKINRDYPRFLSSKKQIKTQYEIYRKKFTPTLFNLEGRES
jgi:hypothetical protein